MERVVFVVGCPRSGTTLVQQMLNAHPKVLIGPETHFVHRFWTTRDRYGDLRTDAAWKRLVRDVAEIPELIEGQVDPVALQKKAAALPREPQALLRLLLEMFASGGNVSVVGEKTPHHILYMPLLQKWFPEAHFVHVLRDPRAVVSSWRRMPWTRGTLFQDALIWRQYFRTAERDSSADTPVLTVRYERLVGDPENEVRRLCRFVGVSFHRSMLEYHRGGTRGLDAGREPWKAGATRPVYATAVDRWREELSSWQILQIEATVGSAIERAGYSPTAPRFLRIAGSAPLRTAARIGNAIWRLRGDS